MTNRRKGSKGKASLSKKSESPDKQTRKVARRSKRNRKSDSPEEQPEEVGSEYSVDENTEDDEARGLYDNERNENDGAQGENDQYETGNKSEDQKSLLKEEESGGSDGSWKVKSENGGSGGIPKLKLCLTRPPDMSSPTSEQPSPRRRRRGRAGNASPAKDDTQQQEEAVHEEKESPKRSTRSQRAKGIIESEVAVEVKAVEVDESVVTEVCDSTNINHSENEDETQMAVDSITDGQKQEEETEEIVSQNEREVQDETQAEKVEVSREVVEQEEVSVQQVEESRPEESAECAVHEEKAEDKENDDGKEELNKETDRVELRAPEAPPQVEVVDSAKPEVKESDTNAEEHTQPKETDEQECISIEEQKEVEMEAPPLKRSPSRDSSEERAKEAALLSRNKYKKPEALEEGEVVESRMSEKSTASSRTEDLDKTRAPLADHKGENKDNQEDSIPTKANNRKRRWGASTSRVSKKPSVSISTDFLKEIIPEVKPLSMSEVQLSPNEEEEEGQVKDSEENLPVVAKKLDREKMVQSDESEKDYEEEAVESGAEESPKNESVKAAPHLKEKEFTTFTRKVSVLPSNDINRLQRSPSPPRHKPSNILYIINLVRPFTIPQLRELLARTGTIAEDGFWIDKIKSRCYVKYETEEEAKTTRHALHGVRWPVSNPKQLNVDFGTEAAMKAAQEGNEILPKRPIPSLFDKQIELKTSDKNRERDERSREKKERNEKEKKESRSKHREGEKREEDEKEKKARPAVEPLARDRTVRRVTVPVREWDVGKNEDGFSPPPDGIDFGRHRDDRYERRVEYERDKRDDYDERRRRDKERGRRSISNEPPRKCKKKSEEEAPAKLLDDLFRKTKATPCIYWLPLTSEQIAVKEELRRKHMAEHEKRVAELRKIQRDQNKRSSDKRRRRSKSRSRSRSPKK